MKSKPSVFTCSLVCLLIHRLSATSIIIALICPLNACDVCLRLPRVPFEIEDVGAIEVALATREAANLGEIDLNPLLERMDTSSQYLPTRLNTISPQELVHRWSRTRPARKHSNLRFTMELVFVDAERTCGLDVRFGDILDGAPGAGPADVRLFTTKAGFCRLLQDGFEACEKRKLIAIDGDDQQLRAELAQLFSTTAESQESVAAATL